MVSSSMLIMFSNRFRTQTNVTGTYMQLGISLAASPGLATSARLVGVANLDINTVIVFSTSSKLIPRLLRLGRFIS